ncbi:hypothetical protein M2262_003484 [Pseudomonas sp. BIGb0408]|uniref:Uncharacterized protein n=1 Tax=Phytopseudomonas flavescens TaxID=29435 RepID=A0A7Y9XIH4_9GAMM|nr:MULTISPECIES: hypothetical protein [Pseudomonas]MCW2293434.1 hypothetical protein [Pseudomonas sp. BIGb0408]NYH71995.1 hypothetical protein [Pseudomonas flavescens]
MNDLPTLHYLFAECRKTCPQRPEVTAIVLFALLCEDDDVVYLEIRYTDYASGQFEGDHLWLSLEEAMHSALEDHGIAEDDWRALSAREIARIDRTIE